MREVRLREGDLPAGGLRALLVWMYTERVDIPVEDVAALQLVARHAKCAALTAAVAAELRTMKCALGVPRSCARRNCSSFSSLVPATAKVAAICSLEPPCRAVALAIPLAHTSPL